MLYLSQSGTKYYLVCRNLNFTQLSCTYVETAYIRWINRRESSVQDQYPLSTYLPIIPYFLCFYIIVEMIPYCFHKQYVFRPQKSVCAHDGWMQLNTTPEQLCRYFMRVLFRSCATPLGTYRRGTLYNTYIQGRQEGRVRQITRSGKVDDWIIDVLDDCCRCK